MAKRRKFAGAVTVGAKGQIVIPKEVREFLHIEPGDSLLLLADEARGIALPPKEQINDVFTKIFGGTEQ